MRWMAAAAGRDRIGMAEIGAPDAAADSGDPAAVRGACGCTADTLHHGDMETGKFIGMG